MRIPPPVPRLAPDRGTEDDVSEAVAVAWTHESRWARKDRPTVGTIGLGAERVSGREILALAADEDDCLDVLGGGPDPPTDSLPTESRTVC